MAIEFTCPACGCTLRVGAGPTGRLVRCGGCVSLLRVPAVPTSPPTPLTPEPATRPLAVAPPPEESNWEHYRQPRRRLFWIMVTLVVLAIGGIVICGGLLMLTENQQWRLFESKAGGFQAEFPGEPKDALNLPWLKPEPGRTVLGSRAAMRDEVFAVGYETLPEVLANPPATDEERLAQLAAKFVASADVKTVVRNVPLVANGFPAHEVEFVAKDGRAYIRRQVLAGTRLYTLFAGGRRSRSRDANVQHFLASFMITDPKLLAIARKRADQARLAAEALEQLRQRTERDRLRAVGMAAAAATFEPIEAELDRQQTERDGLQIAGVVVGRAVAGVMIRELEARPVAPLPRVVRPK